MISIAAPHSKHYSYHQYIDSKYQLKYYTNKDSENKSHFIARRDSLVLVILVIRSVTLLFFSAALVVRYFLESKNP